MKSIRIVLVVLIVISIGGSILTAQAPPIYMANGRRLTQQTYPIAGPTVIVGPLDSTVGLAQYNACVAANPGGTAMCQVAQTQAQVSDLATRANTALVAICNSTNTAVMQACDAALGASNLYIKLN